MSATPGAARGKGSALRFGLRRRARGSGPGAGAARAGQADLPRSFRWRAHLTFGLLSCAAAGLIWRAVNLQLVNHGFLSSQGDARFSRVVTIAAHRGVITDRYGEPLAVSTPVDSVWVNPKELVLATDQIPRLASALHLDAHELAQRVTSNLDREFLYVARHRAPAEAQKVRDLAIPGVYLTREYQRYYPAGEVTGHVLGFTDVDDAGQEGIELAFDHWLAGEDGAKRVIQDRYGRVVQDVESIRPARPGHDLTLSLDLRVQYLAYRELKRAVRDQRARGGSLVVLDVATGEVLAMVNQPAFNPNDRDQIEPEAYRNRAATDILEPGSAMKPFFVAAALASGRYSDQSIIDTSPGYIKVGSHIFPDEHSLGRINIATILAKSSNVGMAHIALSLDPKLMWSTLTAVGFGRVTASGFPGESAGLLGHYSHWRPIGIVTMSHGYGISVTPLQLAQAYATIGSLGIARPVSLLRVDHAPDGVRVLDEHVCRELIGMLESVVTTEGATGLKAAIPGYRVAGKTGTAWKAMAGGYSTNLYMSVFAGVAPATQPRLAVAVVIDEPSAGLHRGGDVAAPVFSAVVGGALRLLAVPPDEPIAIPADEQPAQAYASRGSRGVTPRDSRTGVSQGSRRVAARAAGTVARR
jgi:cell division protein FtsI (penicillin-binding protein 3)